jgi:hypothetical protein
VGFAAYKSRNPLPAFVLIMALFVCWRKPGSTIRSILLLYQFSFIHLACNQHFLWSCPGKVALITVGGLAAGATVGSAVENFLQVDIVPFLGIHSPAVVVSEFILSSNC